MSEYVKAILAFLSLTVTNLLTNYASNGTPLPVESGQLDWGTLLINLGTTAVGTFSVYQWPNKPASGKHEKSQ